MRPVRLRAVGGRDLGAYCSPAYLAGLRAKWFCIGAAAALAVVVVVRFLS